MKRKTKWKACKRFLLCLVATVVAFIVYSKARPKLADNYSILDGFTYGTLYRHQLPKPIYFRAITELVAQGLIRFDIRTQAFTLTLLGWLFFSIRRLGTAYA